MIVGVHMSLHNTLQFFITNQCNKRCAGCFYSDQLSNNHMDFDLYKKTLQEYVPKFNITKVILLGGEPTLHPRLSEFIEAAKSQLVTIYTNGSNLDVLEGQVSEKVTVRIGVHGYSISEKPLADVKPPNYPVAIVYMLRKDNIHELSQAVQDAETRFDCSYFMISSIRDVAVTKSFWKDTNETLSNKDYKQEVVKFINQYKGKLDIHVANRGTLYGNGHNTCRFINIFPDGSCTLCPFDISLGVKNRPEEFGRRCNKHNECLLQKTIWCKSIQDKLANYRY